MVKAMYVQMGKDRLLAFLDEVKEHYAKIKASRSTSTEQPLKRLFRRVRRTGWSQQQYIALERPKH
jgi:hypothetical protein